MKPTGERREHAATEPIDLVQGLSLKMCAEQHLQGVTVTSKLYTLILPNNLHS